MRAHIFQLLMAAEVPSMSFFAIKWLPRCPRQALQVVEDKTASTGWKLEIGPFPGWKDVPTW